jgi:hypothetical protein
MTVTLGDTTPPSVAITSPTTASTYSTSNSALTLAGTATDNVGVTQVTWANSRGGSGSTTGTTSWTVSGIALQTGTNVLTITARDAAGNTGTASVTVTLGDTTPPSVAIMAPTTASSYTTTNSALTLAGTASDNAGLTRVTWANSRGGGGTATGTTSWTVSEIALQAGTNVLTVIAENSGGTSGSADLTVTYDITPPSVVITSYSYATRNSLILGGTALDDVGVIEVTWTNNRGGSGTATGTTSWTASGIALQPGTNVLTITARDAAGNTGTTKISLKRGM